MRSENEYRIDIKVRNNLILKKIESLGYLNPHDFCLKTGISYVSLLKFTNMKRSIFNTKGKLIPFIKKLCDQLNCLPEEIFSAAQMESCLKDNKRTLEVKEAEMIFLMTQQNSQNILEDLQEKESLEKCVEEKLKLLTKIEQKVIEMRFGLGEYTRQFYLEEIAQDLKVSRERIRQIESKALRKLRHPSRSAELKEFIDPDAVLTEKEKQKKQKLNELVNERSSIYSTNYYKNLNSEQIKMLQYRIKIIDEKIKKLEKE